MEQTSHFLPCHEIQPPGGNYWNLKLYTVCCVVWHQMIKNLWSCICPSRHIRILDRMENKLEKYVDRLEGLVQLVTEKRKADELVISVAWAFWLTLCTNMLLTKVLPLTSLKWRNKSQWRMQRNVGSRGRNRKAMLVSVMVSDLHASPSLIPAEVLQNAFSNFWLFPKQIRTNEGNGEQETVVTKQIIPFPPPS